MKSLATVERETLAQHVVNNWTRSALAAFERAPTIPDPGHGHDEICPIIFEGQTLLVDSDTAVGAISPFTAADLRGFQDGTTLRPGIGWLSIYRPREQRTQTLVPGDPPTKLTEVELPIYIAVPDDDGPDLADLYAGALFSLFEARTFTPAEAGIVEIRQVSPLPQHALYEGDDDKHWSWHRINVPFQRTWQGSRLAA